jgi:hypothetical protein
MLHGLVFAPRESAIRRGRFGPILAAIAVAAMAAGVASCAVADRADAASLPTATITVGPSGTVPFRGATFEFSADQTASFTCSLDGASFTACTSPVRFDDLALGRHVFTVKAANSDGLSGPNQPSRAWTIGPVSVLATTSVAPLTFNGARQPAASLIGRPVRSATRSLDEDEFNSPVPVSRDPLDVTCVFFCTANQEGGGGSPNPSLAHAANLPDTPGLTAGPYLLGIGTGDLSIASSNEFLVTTSYNQLSTFWKSGKPVVKDQNGQPFKWSVPMSSIFGPLYNPANPNNIDAHLNLPPGLQCDPTIYPFGNLSQAQQTATADCVHDIYDTRVIYDAFRNRFWIVAQARNNSAGYYTGLPNQADKVGRRTKLLLAVSVDQDPRDGWIIYWTNATLGDGACNNEGSAPGPAPQCPGSQFTPGDGADYPSIGVSSDYVTLTTNVVNSNPWGGTGGPGYTMTAIGSAGALANGTCGTCAWTYGRFNLGQVCAQLQNSQSQPDCSPFQATLSRNTEPALQHGIASGGWTLMTASFSESSAQAVIGFRKSEGAIAPPLHAAVIPVQPFPGAVPDIPQPSSTSNPNPQQMQISNVGTIALRAAANAGNLFTVWQDCKAWIAGQPCVPSIRLTKVDAPTALSGGSVAPSIDRTFGLRNYKDPPNTVDSYGLAGVDVTSAGDAVVDYERGGPNTFFESRYSAFMHNEADIRPSAVLHAGDSTIVFTPPPPKMLPAVIYNFDTAGIARDPIDGGIWMYHDFASGGNPASVVGEVFGSPHYDLSLIAGIPIVVKQHPPGPGATAFTVQGGVVDVGDARTPLVTGRVFYLGRRIQEQLGTFTLNPIAPGNSQTFMITVTSQMHIPPGPCIIKVVLPSSREEFSTRDNSAEVHVTLHSRKS